MKYLFLIGFAFVLTLCQKDAIVNDSLPLNTEVTIANNTILSNDDENIKLKMVEMKEDSRCPTKTDCFWEGDAAPLFTFYENDREHLFNLHTTLLPKDTTLGKYNIRLIKVLPIPENPGIIPANQYKSVIFITKK